MVDPFASFAPSPDDPATRHFVVVPSDGADLAVRPRAFFVNTDGTAKLRDEASVDVTYNVTAGAWLPVRAVRVLATGTTASLIGVY